MLKRVAPLIGLLLTSCLLVAIGFGGGYYFGVNQKTELEKVQGLTNIQNSIAGQVDFTSFWTAWNLINERYMDGNIGATTSAAGAKEVTSQDKVYGAIKGLVASLGDPYTVFLPPTQKKIFEENISGEFGGVGMELGKKEGVITVIAPLPDTPATRAGVKAGDKISNINSSSTAEMEVDEAVGLIRGPKGTPVIITFFRDGVAEPLVKTLIRETIVIPTIDTKNRPDGIFVIQIHNFSSNVNSLFRDALKQFVESGSNKLVIDLRGNPGGYLEAAVDMASWFLPKEALVVTESHREAKENREYKSVGYNIFTDQLKLVILVDRGSASASEIFAGALQENGKAILVGEKTYGKGSVQQMIALPDSSSIKMTIARWLTPKGRSISHDGLEPDVAVSVKPEDLTAGKDPIMLKAVEILTKSAVVKK